MKVCLTFEVETSWTILLRSLSLPEMKSKLNNVKRGKSTHVRQSKLFNNQVRQLLSSYIHSPSTHARAGVHRQAKAWHNTRCRSLKSAQRNGVVRGFHHEDQHSKIQMVTQSRKSQKLNKCTTQMQKASVECLYLWILDDFTTERRKLVHDSLQ